MDRMEEAWNEVTAAIEKLRELRSQGEAAMAKAGKIPENIQVEVFEVSERLSAAIRSM